MIAASLLLTIRAEPSILDEALANASRAMFQAPAFHCVYEMKNEAEGVAANLKFEFWKDAENQRVETLVDGIAQLKSWKSARRMVIVLPTEKKYIDWEGDTAASRKTEEASALELGSWRFNFKDDYRIILESNPPFEPSGEEIVKEDGHQVRYIAFRARNPSNDHVLKGTARFEVDTKLFLGMNLQVDGGGAKKQTFAVERKLFEVGKPDISNFVIPTSEYEGFDKVAASGK